MAQKMLLLNDFTTTVRKALTEIDPEWETYRGLIVCGTHRPQDIQRILEAIRGVREKGECFLGICAGHQMAAIEYAKNVLGQEDATSEEWDTTGTFIVKKLPQLHVGLHDGETYWNNYAVVDGFDNVWEKAENFITCQFHPEYQSSKEKPHPLLKQFLSYARRMAM